MKHLKRGERVESKKKNKTENPDYEYRSLEMEIRFLLYFLSEMQKEKPSSKEKRVKKILGIYQAYMGTYLGTFADISNNRIQGCRARVEFTEKDIEALISLRREEMEKIKNKERK